MSLDDFKVLISRKPGEELHQLDAEIFEVEDLVEVEFDLADSISSCCSCSTSSCYSCSTSCSTSTSSGN